MFEVRKTETFDAWLNGLKDIRAKASIAGRVERLELGHFGDVSPVGEGISELRVHTGPGYRVYFKQTGTTIILLLCGGDKNSQARDVKRAKATVVEIGKAKGS